LLVKKKLAIQFHPDKNKSQEAEDKFKKISSAYAILSDPQKRKNYDMGIPEGLSGIDPFSMFNQFFANQNMDTFVNDFFSTQSQNPFMGSFDDILGGSDVKFSIHSFTEMPNMGEDMNFFDILNKTKETLKTAMNKKKEIKEKEMQEKIQMEQTISKLQKKVYNKFENIEKKINVSVEDILDAKSKKIKYTISSKQPSSKWKQNETKFTFQLQPDLEKISYTFEEKGHQHYQYKQNGDLIIKLNIYNNLIKYNNVKKTLLVPILLKKIKKLSFIQIYNKILKIPEDVEEGLYQFDNIYLIVKTTGDVYKKWKIIENSEDAICGKKLDMSLLLSII